MDNRVEHSTKPHPLEIYGDTRRIARVSYVFTSIILVSLPVGVVILLFGGNLQANSLRAAEILGLSMLPILVALFLIRRAQFEWAAILLAVVLLTMITGVSTLGLGAHHLANFGYPALLIVASLVTRKRTMVFLTLYAIGCAGWLVFGEIYGIFTPTVLTRSVPGDFFTMALIITATAVMVRILTEALFQNNLRLQQELRERRRVEERLEQDIALRLQAEAEREQLIVELEARNAELERFTYTVSHDLKSPLITIRGFLGLMEKDALAGNMQRVRHDMARIVEATDRMQRLLSELLELSRIGRMMNPPESVPFDGIVREVLELARGRLEAGGVRVEVTPGLPNVHGDRARLVEVVQNLVENAAKYMGDQAQPRIEIGVRGGEGGPVFYVRDNGLGIDPAYHDNVFGLFNKLDPASEGTGVGLALAKRIVEVHGGRIWVESKGAGHGSTFCFTLAEQA